MKTRRCAAVENARCYCNISDKEYALIRTHKGRFTLFHAPRYKEGWFICIADKMVSIKETIHVKNIPLFPQCGCYWPSRKEKQREKNLFAPYDQ
jgi:hypothetical protein